MKQRLTLFILLLLFIASAQAQTQLLPSGNDPYSRLAKIANDKNIDAATTLKLLHNWNNFPAINKTGQDYTWFYTDSIFGKMPVRVFIPSSYKSNQPSPCIILLHGAVGLSKFTDIAYPDSSDDLTLFAQLKQENYIIIRPIADASKKFSWAVNEFNDRPIPTYTTLSNMLIALKHILNINDAKVFAFGHSDGSDGAIGLGIYKPDAFAGVVAYNSMLSNIFAYNYYISNIANRPLHLVHSDKDDIRPIQQTREVLAALKPIDDTIHYKEYFGYVHQDKHLQIDLPAAIQFMHGLERNSYRHHIYWEASDTIYSTCDWLHITRINTQTIADWYKPLIVKSYNKNTGQFFTNYTYYQTLKQPAAIDASYDENTIRLKTSGVEEIELKISPQMVDLGKPVMVYANDKLIYSGKITADKQYIIENFMKNFDRDALWVNVLRLKAD